MNCMKHAGLFALAAVLSLVAGSLVVNAQAPSAEAQPDRSPPLVKQSPGVGVAIDAQRNGVRTREVTYVVDGRTHRGFLATPKDATADDPRPGVLVVHEWWGRNAYADRRARQLAELGYVAFAVDMYGEGQVVDTPERARNLATPFYTDRSLMVKRATAGLEQLTALAEVDSGRLAAIGYCFGGSVALELARDGARLNAVASFHGGLSSTNAMRDAGFTGIVFVANGAADELVSIAERNAFITEMEAADADYVFIEYGNAVHSFTNPEADDLGMNSVGYDEHADRRSWLHMLLVFEEAFAE